MMSKITYSPIASRLSKKILTFVRITTEYGMTSDKFDNIGSYHDDQVVPVLQELLANEKLQELLDYYVDFFQSNVLKEIKKKAGEAKSIQQFQEFVSAPLVNFIIDYTSNGVRFRGLKYIKKRLPALFISNHRDIVLDSAILSAFMINIGKVGVEIAIGNNLLVYPWIEHVVRLNRSFIVKRDSNVRQMLEISRNLSNYIRHTVTESNSSIWLAQREGRTKDGNDKTQVSLIKMLSLSGDSNQDLIARLQQLNIIPLSIAYEYEPCIDQKVFQTYMKRDETYQKEKKEDLLSMWNGMREFKGRIRCKFAPPLNDYLDTLKTEELSKKELLEKVVEKIDESIYRCYKLFPNNFIAYDMLNKCSDYKSFYTILQKRDFLHYMRKSLRPLPKENRDELEMIFLKIYATPLVNKQRFL